MNPNTIIPVSIDRECGKPFSPQDILIADVCNTSDAMINLRVIFEGAHRQVLVRIGLFPKWPTRIALPIQVAEGGTLFLRRTPGTFKSVVEGANLKAEEIHRIRLTSAPETLHLLQIEQVHLSKSMPGEYTFPDTPLVDALHQWSARDWPGKTKTISEMSKALQAELTAPPPHSHPDRSAYGGCLRHPFEATGWFRTHHDGQRWWLVDPDGGAFWSSGVDCVRPDANVNVTGIEHMFAAPLPDPAQNPHLCEERNGSKFVEAQKENLEKALGTEWFDLWCELTRRRMLDYGFNTIANWSDPILTKRAGIPYVFTMKKFPATSPCIFRDFPDVFSDEYPQRSRDFAAQLTEIADDRNVIGYFMNNEPKWSFLTDFNLAVQVLRNDQPSCTRDALIDFLKSRYPDIDALNQVWHTHLKTFDDFQHRQIIEGDGHQPDTMAFTCMAVERLIRIPAEACRAVAPRHLNLGLRWAWIHSAFQLAGSSHVDVFSINCYEIRPDAKLIADLSAKTGKPLMIGEFHVGALDRGLPSGGIRNVRTMQESADALRYYVENAATIPDLVGAHYFMWNDQHVMGRFDGENMQIGLHDICYKPYPEMVDACRKFNAGIPSLHRGEQKPDDQPPNLVIEGSLIG